jgi:hypothetical protein
MDLQFAHPTGRFNAGFALVTPLKNGDTDKN